MREIRIKGWPLFGYRPCLERFVHIERDLDLKRSAKTIECQAADIASVFRLVMLFERVDRLARIATCSGRGAREGSIRITISLCLIAEQVRHLLLLCGTLPIRVSFYFCPFRLLFGKSISIVGHIGYAIVRVPSP